MAKTTPKFGTLDIPLSCSMFLEPALKKYKRYIAPISDDTVRFVHEWNVALVSVVQRDEYKPLLGEIGRKIISGTIRSDAFPANCVDRARDVPLQSLHYALRFSESVKFLADKINTSDNAIKFVDLGCGLSPMAAAVKTEYNMDYTYCIDMPEIIDVYDRVAGTVGVRAPSAIDWNTARSMTGTGALNTIVAMGVLPYMPIDEQVRRLNFINQHFTNFMVEVKYNTTPNAASDNVFTVQRLQRLRLETANAHTLETKLIQNSLRYLRRFMGAMPDKRYFLESNRSLFLSR